MNWLRKGQYDKKFSVMIWLWSLHYCSILGSARADTTDITEKWQTNSTGVGFLSPIVDGINWTSWKRGETNCSFATSRYGGGIKCLQCYILPSIGEACLETWEELTDSDGQVPDGYYPDFFGGRFDTCRIFVNRYACASCWRCYNRNRNSGFQYDCSNVLLETSDNCTVKNCYGGCGKDGNGPGEKVPRGQAPVGLSSNAHCDVDLCVSNGKTFCSIPTKELFQVWWFWVFGVIVAFLSILPVTIWARANKEAGRKFWFYFVLRLTSRFVEVFAILQNYAESSCCPSNRNAYECPPQGSDQDPAYPGQETRGLQIQLALTFILESVGFLIMQPGISVSENPRDALWDGLHEINRSFLTTMVFIVTVITTFVLWFIISNEYSQLQQMAAIFALMWYPYMAIVWIIRCFGREFSLAKWWWEGLIWITIDLAGLISSFEGSTLSILAYVLDLVFETYVASLAVECFN